MKQHVTSQEQILEKTMEIAIREGVDSVSIRKLASACGIAIGSVYNYYPNKEAVIAAVAEQFWDGILNDQEKLYRRGMGFTGFLEQYYSFLYGRLAQYDKGWLSQIAGSESEKKAIAMLKTVLYDDKRINQSIWNMELNEDAFCEYVMTNIMALLQAGENNCRFFIFLLEHLLYDV
ncbi:MAG: TetR/AcrR family transcriptional regulator [Agathobacter sp.]